MKLDKAPGGGRSDAEELLLRVAWFYYKDELTQEEIARRLSVSRASVGRMLDRARKVGLVTINLNADHLNAFEVSSQLRRTFGLSEALVVPDHQAEPTDHHVLNARLGIGGAQSGRERHWEDLVQYVTEAERLGVDDCWNAEAWGLDAMTPLAYLAGQTSRIRLGTSIAQISARVPSMAAMTALTLAAMSGDRFVLGLGVSGPQVVEGLHGVPFTGRFSGMRWRAHVV